MKMPNQVKVGGHQISIKIAPRSDIKGSADYRCYTKAIRVADDMAPSEVGTSVVHEILHAMWHSSGLYQSYKPKTEEDIVKTLEPWLYQVMRDNPKLVRWIMEAE